MWEKWEERYSDCLPYILIALTCNTSIHQTTSACKNKAKRFQFIPNHKAKIITLFDHEELEKTCFKLKI